MAQLYQEGRRHQQGYERHGRRLRPYAAIGSGQPWAEASLFTTADMQLDPRVRIRFALLAAQAHSVSVKEPFLFLESERRP